MRPLVPAALLYLMTLLLTSCGSGAPVAPGLAGDPEATGYGLPTGARLPAGDLVTAQFQVALDPDTLTAEVLPVRVPQAQPPQGLMYDLDIQQFLKADSFRLLGARTTAAGDFELEFSHAHPFPAPDFSASISGLNRADLGYTGRLLILAEGPAVSYFGGEVTMPVGAVIDADGYLNAGDLLSHTGLANDTFPYVLLVDEAQDNRAGRSNGGTMTGNYAPVTGGWQRGNAGGDGAGWVGYDYLHGGQRITNTFTLGGAALAGAGFRFSVAILIKYVDPRGAGGRSLRIPPEPADVLNFAYRLPYAALDCSKLTLTAPLTVNDLPAGDTASVSLRIRDWDAAAPEGADSTVGDDPDVSRIQQGAAGAPVVTLVCPALSAAPVTLTVGPAGSGRPNDEKIATGTLTNVLGEAAPGRVWACVKVVDPEDADPAQGTYRFGVDPGTILPDPARALRVRTYQLLPVEVRSTALPPVITGVTPSGLVGEAGDTVQFAATVANGATGWSWNFGPGASPSTSTQASPTVTLGPAGFYTGYLTVTNGAGPSPQYQFNFTVDPKAPVWSNYLITSAGASGTSTDIVLYQNKPVISFYVSGDTDLYVAIATKEVPTAPGDWLVYAVDDEGDVGKDTSICVSNDRLAISYFDETNGDLKLALATVASPTSKAQWNRTQVDTLLDVGDESAIIDQAGRLTIAYHSVSGGALKVARAQVNVPTGPSDWVTMVVDARDNAGNDKDMVELNGRLVIAHSVNGLDDLRCSIAKVANPLTESDWDTHDVDTDGVVGEEPSLAIHNGLLSLTYDYDTGDDLRFARAKVEFPASGADWEFHDVDTIGNTGERTSLVYADGRPAVSYFDNSKADLRFARAKVAEPVSTADWQLLTIDAGSVGRENTKLIVLADGTFAIVYQRDVNLAFARAAAPW
ncbi:MAG: hypothetical protein GEEBNDBF_02219 [bacterium]|nr:hypothetical protein [bacterium]